MKVLIVSDAGVATGFARVMEGIIKHFPEEWELHHIGINYYGDPYPSRSQLYPASINGDIYGIGRLKILAEKLKPDAILILQDSWVIQHYLKVLSEEDLAKTVLYVPVDAAPYMPEWLELFPKVKRVVAYTEFGRTTLYEAKPEIRWNTSVIPHGIDTDAFFPIDQNEARKELGKMTPDLKIFLNTSRNQPRKRLDILAKAFGIFSQDKDDVRYYHHAGVEDAGWDMVKMARRCEFSDKLILTSRDISPQRYVSDETLNLIYNSADVGLNFSMGEGWGLCFGKGTRVLTTSGFKNIEDILIGDEVFDKGGKPTEVTNISMREYSGPMQALKFVGTCNTFLATPEHPFYAEEGFVEAKELTPKKHKLLRPDISPRELFSTVDIGKYSTLRTFNQWALIQRYNVGVKVRKGELETVRRVLNKNVSINSYRKLNRDIKLDMDLTYLLLPYLLGKRRAKALKEVDENQKLAAKKIFNFVETFRTTNVVLGKELIDMLHKLAYDQEVYLSLPIECIKYLFESLLKHQSYTKQVGKKVYLSGRAPEKVDVIRIILLRLGVGFSETPSKSGTVYFTIDKKYVSFAKKYVTRRSDKYETVDGYFCRVINNNIVDYTGTVYNLETESHTYNVHGYAVHNCNMEHSIVGKPQIVAAHSALLELYDEGRGLFVPINHYDTMPKILTEGAVVSVQHAAQAMQYAYDNPEVMKEIGQKAREYFLQPQFQWENISKKFQELLEE